MLIWILSFDQVPGVAMLRFCSWRLYCGLVICYTGTASSFFPVIKISVFMLAMTACEW